MLFNALILGSYVRTVIPVIPADMAGQLINGSRHITVDCNLCSRAEGRPEGPQMIRSYVCTYVQQYGVLLIYGIGRVVISGQGRAGQGDDGIPVGI